MEKLGTAISESILYHYGSAELLSRLSDPFWFQAFGSVMGMDWHSSGITTSVMGALKRGLNPKAHELGIHICGGAANTREHAGRTAGRGGEPEPRWRSSGDNQPADCEGGQQCDCGWISDLPAQLRGDRGGRVGGNPARHESTSAVLRDDITGIPHRCAISHLSRTRRLSGSTRADHEPGRQAAKPAQDAMLSIAGARSDPAPRRGNSPYRATTKFGRKTWT